MNSRKDNFNPLMVTERSHLNKSATETSKFAHVCVTFLVPPGIKELTL